MISFLFLYLFFLNSVFNFCFFFASIIFLHLLPFNFCSLFLSFFGFFYFYLVRKICKGLRKVLWPNVGSRSKMLDSQYYFILFTFNITFFNLFIFIIYYYFYYFCTFRFFKYDNMEKIPEIILFFNFS